MCWVISNVPDKCQRSYLKSLMYGRWHLEKSFYKSGPPTSALSLMVSKSRVHTFSRTRLHFITLPITAFWALLVPFGILHCLVKTFHCRWNWSCSHKAGSQPIFFAFYCIKDWKYKALETSNYHCSIRFPSHHTFPLSTVSLLYEFTDPSYSMCPQHSRLHHRHHHHCFPLITNKVFKH